MTENPPPECVSLREIYLNREEYPWFPDFAEVCGTWNGQVYYRENQHPTPPPPIPPPPGEPPPECVPLNEILMNPQDYPWYPGSAGYCGHFREQEYYRPLSLPPPGDDGTEEEAAGREKQPAGEVGEDEASEAYADDSQDDLRPHDPE